MREVRAALIGAGFIGPLHVEALRRIGVPVVGVLSSSLERARRSADGLGLPRAYADLAELLADPEVDVVHIASPNRHHATQVLAALAAGKHVVCEKPLAMTSDEAKELCEAAQANPQLVTAVNYNYRFAPMALQMRAMINGGSIGEIFHIRGSYTQDWLHGPYDFNWRVLAEEGGALRAVADIGTHWIDLVRFVTGLEIEEVMADLDTVWPTRYHPRGNAQTFQNEPGQSGPGQSEQGAEAEPVRISTEDYASVLLRFSNGRRGVLTVSQVVAGRKNALELEIAGSARALAWALERSEELWVGERHEANRVLLRDPALVDASVRQFVSYPGGHSEGFADMFKNLYRAVYKDINDRRDATRRDATRRNSTPLYATFEDGWRELRICEAILQSAREERWISV